MGSKVREAPQPQIMGERERARAVFLGYSESPINYSDSPIIGGWGAFLTFQLVSEAWRDKNCGGTVSVSQTPLLDWNMTGRP